MVEDGQAIDRGPSDTTAYIWRITEFEVAMMKVLGYRVEVRGCSGFVTALTIDRINRIYDLDLDVPYATAYLYRVDNWAVFRESENEL